MRSALIVVFLFSSLQLYGQRDSLQIHNKLIGVGTNVFPLFAYKNPSAILDWGYSLYIRKSTEKIDLRGEVMFGFYGQFLKGVVVGIGNRQFKESRFQVIYAIEGIYLNDKDFSYKHIGVGPVLGIQYRIVDNIHLVHELGFTYGYYKEYIDDWDYVSYLPYIHKLLSLEMLFGF